WTLPLSGSITMSSTVPRSSPVLEVTLAPFILLVRSFCTQECFLGVVFWSVSAAHRTGAWATRPSPIRAAMHFDNLRFISWLSLILSFLDLFGCTTTSHEIRVHSV